MPFGGKALIAAIEKEDMEMVKLAIAACINVNITASVWFCITVAHSNILCL